VNEVVWPMGMDRDLSSRPLVFNPRGFLVTLFETDDEAEKARVALEDARFPSEDLRVYTSREICDDHERYLEERSRTRKVVGALTDDVATIEQYFGHARSGGAALWVHVSDRHDASRAVSNLADHKVSYFRYYGQEGKEDIQDTQDTR
jgi:hypothetical protein